MRTFTYIFIMIIVYIIIKIGIIDGKPGTALAESLLICVASSFYYLSNPIKKEETKKITKQ